MVKGLAKLGNRLRHDLMVKYVDVSLFEAKRGYSPMTPAILISKVLSRLWLDISEARKHEAGQLSPVVKG